MAMNRSVLWSCVIDVALLVFVGCGLWLTGYSYGVECGSARGSLRTSSAIYDEAVRAGVARILDTPSGRRVDWIEPHGCDAPAPSPGF